MGEKEDNEVPKGPAWLTSPGWWISIAAIALTLYFVRHFV
jgi:hypothetical protein